MTLRNRVEPWSRVSGTSGTAAISVATISALKALVGSDLAGEVLVDGYYAAGDGGGGLFRWNGSDTTADNGGTVIIPNAGGTGRWNRIMPDANVYHVRDFGAKGDGATDDYAAINACLTAAATAKAGVRFDSAGTYLTSASIIVTSSTVPLWIDGLGATIKAKSGFTSNPLVKVENPHATVPHFWMANLTLNGNALTSKGLYVHGCQYACFSNIVSTNNGGYGIHIQGEPNYGVYYTTFLHCTSGITTYSGGNASTGWIIESINNSSGYYVADNTFVNCASQFNKGNGFSLDYANVSLVGCDAEINDLYGISVDHCTAVDVFGGYTENNNQNRATRANGTGNGNPDGSVNTTANTSNFRLFGGRHIGAQSGTFTGAGNWWQPGQGTTNPTLDSSGNLNVIGKIGGNGNAGANITGVSDSTAAVAGQVGELVESKQTTFQNAAATGTWLALTSIALTAGDWDIEAVAEVYNNSATTTGSAQAAISTTSAAGGVDGDTMLLIPAGLMSGGQEWPITFPRTRVQITASTTYYLNVMSRFSAGTPQWAGKISARRMR